MARRSASASLSSEPRRMTSWILSELMYRVYWIDFLASISSEISKQSGLPPLLELLLVLIAFVACKMTIRPCHDAIQFRSSGSTCLLPSVLINSRRNNVLPMLSFISSC